MEIEDGVATFPNGLKLRLTPGEISGNLIYDAAMRWPDPPVPVVAVKRDGAVVREENPDDPEYARAVEQAKERRAWAAIRTLVMLGTELVEAPRGVNGPDAIDWERVAVIRDAPVPSSKYERYEMWTRYYGFAHGYKTPAAGLAEYADLCRYLAVEAGITMEAPSAIAATFRTQAGRPADSGGDAVAAAVDGAVR